MSSHTTLSVSKALKIPVTHNISTEPVRPLGSIVFETDTNTLYISTPNGWVSGGGTLHPETSRGMMSQDIVANSVLVGKYLKMPVVTNIATTPIQIPGSIVYDKTTGLVYTSGGATWAPSSGGSVSLASVGSGTSIVANGVGPALTVKSISVVGLSISSTLTDITITNNAVLSVTAANSTIVIGGTPNNPTVSGNYVAGSGISVIGNTITNTSPGGSSITLGSTGTGTSLVSGGVGPALTNKSLSVIGPGLGISSTGTEITLTNGGVLSVAAANSTIIIGGTPSNPTVAGGYVAGSGINISGNSIANTSPASAITLTSEPGLYSVVSSNSINPTLITKTIAAGANITITDIANVLTISTVSPSSVLGFSARKSGILTLLYPVDNTITGWTTAASPDYDTEVAFNVVSGVYTASSSGIHSVIGMLSVDAPNNSGTYVLSIRINGSISYETEDQPQSNSLNPSCLRIEANPLLSIGDTVELHLVGLNNTIGTNVDIIPSPRTWFSVLQL